MSLLTPSVDLTTHRFYFSAPQDLIQLITSSNLVLLDNSSLSSNSMLCQRLYDSHNLATLDNLFPELEFQKQHLHYYAQLIDTYPTIQTIPSIISEINALNQIFAQSYEYHCTKYQSSNRDRYISKPHKKPPHSHSSYPSIPTFKNNPKSIRNKRLQQEYLEELSFSSPLPSSIELLHEISILCEHIATDISHYTDQSITVPSVGKSSATDCELIGAAIGKSIQEYNTVYPISILTKDYDIPRLLYNYLHTNRLSLHFFTNLCIYKPCNESREQVQKFIL